MLNYADVETIVTHQTFMLPCYLGSGPFTFQCRIYVLWSNVGQYFGHDGVRREVDMALGRNDWPTEVVLFTFAHQSVVLD